MLSKGIVGVVMCLFGAILALVAPVCAWAQGNWSGQQDAHGSAYQAGSLPPPATRWPATRTSQPLGSAAPTGGQTTYTPAASGVVPATYDAPRGFETPQRIERPILPEQTSPIRSEADGPTLPHRGSDRLPARKQSSAASSAMPKGLSTLWTTGGALALVLGAFFVFAWIMRRAAPKTTQALPSDVVEVLGRAPLVGRQQMHLVRCGGKLLLVNVTADGAQTLTEITDPVEVDRLAGMCGQGRSGSATAAFRQVFEQFSPTARTDAEIEDELAASSLFRDHRAPVREGRDV